MTEAAELIIDSLVQAARSDQLLVIIGSGLSASCGLPTLRELAISLQNPDPDLTDIPGEFSRFAARHGIPELNSFLEGQLGKTSPTLDAITGLLLEIRCAAFVSTNCDHIIEAAASQLGLPLRVFVDDSDLTDFHSTPAVKLIKLHGTLDRKETLTYTREQYKARRSSASALYTTVAGLMAYCRTLLLGYSVSDPDLLEIELLAGGGQPDRMSQMVGIFSKVELANTQRSLTHNQSLRSSVPLLEFAYEDFEDSPSADLKGFLTQFREHISPASSPRLSKQCIILTNGYTATLKTELTSYIANCLSVPLLATHRYGPCTAHGLLQDDLRNQRYEELLLDAGSFVARNYSVVLDGTFTNPEWRERVYSLAITHGVTPIIIKTVCDDEFYILARLWRRKLDHSRSEHEVTEFENFIMTRNDMTANPCEEDAGFGASGAEVVIFRNDSHRSVTIGDSASIDARLIVELIKVSPLMSIAI